jgi:hypothetical protein
VLISNTGYQSVSEMPINKRSSADSSQPLWMIFRGNLEADEESPPYSLPRGVIISACRSWRLGVIWGPKRRLYHHSFCSALGTLKAPPTWVRSRRSKPVPLSVAVSCPLCYSLKIDLGDIFTSWSITSESINHLFGYWNLTFNITSIRGLLDVGRKA